METLNNICPMSKRRYEEVPIDQVKVINSRNREKEQFTMNVESIESVGLMKPIRVNDKFIEATGFYELICGEGRLLAHQQLGKKHVMAEIVTCTRKEALLQSLIENIARTKPGSMDFARELKRLHDEGLDYKQIAKIACKTEEYIRGYIRLVEQGEERLIQGVESEIFPIKFAIQVASTEDSQIQGVLMDAFAEGLVTTLNFGQARRIIAARAKSSKKSAANRDYTVNQLQHDIAESTRVNARDVGRCRDLTPERIKQQLRRLCTTGYDLGAKVNRSRDRAHYDAAVRHFGSWREALTAAGINMANVTHRRPKHLDRESMLLWLRNRQASGQTLVYSEVGLENRDHALAIRREFGSWARAVAEVLPSNPSGDS